MVLDKLKSLFGIGAEAQSSQGTTIESGRSVEDAEREMGLTEDPVMEEFNKRRAAEQRQLEAAASAKEQGDNARANEIMRNMKGMDASSSDVIEGEDPEAEADLVASDEGVDDVGDEKIPA